MKSKIIILCCLTAVWICLLGVIGAAESTTSQAPAAPPQAPVSGKITEALKAGQYTYFHLDDGKKKVWVATYATSKAAVGDEVRVGDYMVMENFKSKTLNRTFETVLFAGQIQLAGETNTAVLELPPGHPTVSQAKPQAPQVEKNSIKKPRGGYSVAECFSKKKSLAQKTISVRGVVVKATLNIMDRNWIHIQDGTGDAGSNDLTVTTKETAEMGDVVVVTGKINYDKNFGAGYVFPVIIEDAAVSREGTYKR